MTEPVLTAPPLWAVLPFVALLGTIALAPLLVPDWWNRHYAKVSAALGLLTLGYYLLGRGAFDTVLHTGLDYISFMALIGSLFVVAGGIHITVRGEATPGVNVAFLAVGAVLANFLGTTGAAMLLIRPWLRMNKYRITHHHVVFFIFTVCNVGGCLTPIGDPPLFLGYLRGIPFWWVVQHCWPMWVVGVSFLLLTFYIADRRNYVRAPKEVRTKLAEPSDQWRFDGLSNVVFLGVILAAVFVTEPPYVREVMMVAAAIGSYYTTQATVHEANHFNFHPIREVAILFAGIFSTMIPALDWLQMNAGKMGAPGTGFFYWGSGLLSSVLDNAPTYLSFLKAVIGTFVHSETVAQVKQLMLSGGEIPGGHDAVGQTVAALHQYFASAVKARQVSTEQVEIAYLLGNPSFNLYIVAISVGSVFFGANTYIGNGPNLMVKSIAEHQKVHMPTFLGYIFLYTLPVMFPMLLLVGWIFFR